MNIKMYEGSKWVFEWVIESQEGDGKGSDQGIETESCELNVWCSQWMAISDLAVLGWQLWWIKSGL